MKRWIGFLNEFICGMPVIQKDIQVEGVYNVVGGIVKIAGGGPVFVFGGGLPG